MASFGATFSGRPATLVLDVVVASQDIVNNTSTISFQLAIRNDGTTSWSNGYSHWDLVIEGNSTGGDFTYDFRSIPVGGTLVLTNGNYVIGHNADGTRQITVAAQSNADQLGSAVTGTQFITLPTIPRASTPSMVGTGIIGTAQTINTNRLASGFTHTLQYFFGSTSGTIATNVATSVSWTPPTSLLNQIPNSTSGNGFIRCITFSGATQIGIKDTAVNLKAATTVIPDFTGITNSEATPGLAANVGAYVQSLSKLLIGITGAVGAFGSTITGYKIVVAGQTINAQSGTTPAVISAFGSVAITCTVTDSRGRSVSKFITVSVLQYGPPAITSIDAERALVDGTPDDNGTYVRINILAGIASLVVGGTQKNAIRYRVSSRLRGTTTWTPGSIVTPGGITITTYALVGTFAIEDAFDFLVEIMDDFSTSAQQFTIPTAKIFMHWDASEGMGVGKFRENGMLDVLGQIYQNDGQEVLDFDNYINLPLPVKMAAGKVVLGILAAAASQDTTVTLPVGKFDVAPLIVVTSGTTRYTLQVTEGSVTTSGFTIRSSNWSPGGASGTSTATWVAVQMTPTTAESSA